MKDVGISDLPFPGAVDNGGSITFSLYAPNKKSVHLIGDFNNWDNNSDKLEEISDGYWSITKDLPQGIFTYQFLLDGEHIICDPYAKYIDHEFQDKPHKAIVRPFEEAYEWQHNDWNRPKFEDLAIMEVHIADFTPQRDFREAIDRLDYVRDLGINCIELMPIFGVDENKGWGYAPTYLFAPNEDYGTANELKWLIDEAHARGIAVLLDMVLAHTGHKHPFNEMYDYDKSPWYGSGPNGGNEYGLPQLDYSKPAARNFAKDVLGYWLMEYNVDGFRFDYVSGMGVTDEGYGMPTLVWASRQTRADGFLIAEHLPENPDGIIAADFNGAWHIRFSFALRALLCEGQNNGFDWNRFGEAVEVLLADKQGYGQKASAMINYLESHDGQRIMYDIKNSGFDDETAAKKSALGAVILFTAVGEPMIYHGQAWGQDTPMNIDHNFIDWENLGTDRGRGLRDHYARMIWLRKEHNALRTTNIAIDSVFEQQKSLVYHRWNDSGNILIVVANFSSQQNDLEVPICENGNWKDFFTDESFVFEGMANLTLEPYSAKILIKN